LIDNDILVTNELGWTKTANLETNGG